MTACFLKLIFNCDFTKGCERSNRVNAVVLGSQEHYSTDGDDVSEDGDDAVETDRAMAGWPREHQYPIEAHELVGPHHSGDSKDQIQLHDKAKN